MLAQTVDATLACSLLAGVSDPNVFLGRRTRATDVSGSTTRLFLRIFYRVLDLSYANAGNLSSILCAPLKLSQLRRHRHGRTTTRRKGRTPMYKTKPCHDCEMPEQPAPVHVLALNASLKHRRGLLGHFAVVARLGFVHGRSP